MILHVDMDAFYASIEQRDFPECAGKPVLVGGTSGRGVVAAASYEARAYGCKSAMPMRHALRLCPDAVVRPPRFSVYHEVSEQIREILETATPLVEPIALDEAFLDVAASESCLGSAEEIGRNLKQRIREATGLIASIGAAPVKFVAKLASDHGKPDGLVVVTQENMLDFLTPLPVERIWGVGPTTLPKLREMGLGVIGDVRKLAPERLEQELGALGRHIWELAHGIDPRPVVPDRELKSISRERTFDEDLSDPEELLAELHLLADDVAPRLRGEGLAATKVFLKVRFSDFETITRQATLGEPTDETAEIWRKIRELWQRERPWARKPIRLLGAGAGGLVRPAAHQPGLFDDSGPADGVDAAVDQVRQRFGMESLRPADSIRRSRRR
jgi:DNA polymerase-4